MPCGTDRSVSFLFRTQRVQGGTSKILIAPGQVKFEIWLAVEEYADTLYTVAWPIFKRPH